MNDSMIYESAAKKHMSRTGIDHENIGLIFASNPSLIIEAEHARCIGQLMAAARGFDKACGGYCGFSMLQDMPDDELKAKLLAGDPDIDDRLRMVSDTGMDAYLHDYRGRRGDYAGIICMKAMSAAHDARCSEHVFEYRKPEEGHLYLPFGMIGKEDAMRYMDFIEPLFDAARMHECLTHDAAIQAYAAHAEEYRLDNKLYDRDAVAAFVSKGGVSYLGLADIDGIEESYRNTIVNGIADDFYARGAGADLYKHDLHDGYVNISDAASFRDAHNIDPDEGFKPASIPVIYADGSRDDATSEVIMADATDVENGRGETVLHYRRHEKLRVPSNLVSPIPMHDIYGGKDEKACSKRPLSGIMRRMEEDDRGPDTDGPEL